MSALPITQPLTHYYAWKNNPDLGLFPCPRRLSLYRRHCRILMRLALNSALVEFENGQREVISRHALRRLASGGEQQ